MMRLLSGLWCLAWLAIWCSTSIARCGVSGQIVTLSTGRLEGELVAGGGGARDYWAFRGIPYAAPPVGNLRFKAPRPALKWDGIANASIEGNPCPQLRNGVVIGSEDCLNLNVFTPTLECPVGGYAVIVFFHGGSLIEGETRSFGPDFLVHHDVIVVLPKYRLGALGFLNLDTADVPGNAGIKDGLAALRWVRDNIGSFCGDPNRVTTMGQSAGAKLVGFMAIAEGGRGLFRAAIQMSGVANSPMAYTEQHVDRGRALAASLGNTEDDIAAVGRTLLQANWEDITRRAFSMYYNSAWGLPYNPFVSSPERRPFDGEEVVLTRNPESLLRDPPVPRVPTLTSVMSREGMVFIGGVLRDASKMDDLAANLTELLRVDFAFPGVAGELAETPTQSRLEDTARRVKDKYLQGQDPSTAYPESLANLVGDMRYLYPLYRWVRYLDNQTAPFYLYLFDRRTEFNLHTTTHVSGAAHGDDLLYVFRMALVDQYQNLFGPGRANQTLREHVKLITDFATTLSAPALEQHDIAGGQPSLRRRPPYLYIGTDFRETRVENTLGAEDRLMFWDSVENTSRAKGANCHGQTGLVMAMATVSVLLVVHR